MLPDNTKLVRRQKKRSDLSHTFRSPSPEGLRASTKQQMLHLLIPALLCFRPEITRLDKKDKKVPDKTHHLK